MPLQAIIPVVLNAVVSAGVNLLVGAIFGGGHSQAQTSGRSLEELLNILSQDITHKMEGIVEAAFLRDRFRNIHDRAGEAIAAYESYLRTYRIDQPTGDSQVLVNALHDIVGAMMMLKHTAEEILRENINKKDLERLKLAENIIIIMVTALRGIGSFYALIVERYNVINPDHVFVAIDRIGEQIELAVKLLKKYIELLPFVQSQTLEDARSFEKLTDVKRRFIFQGLYQIAISNENVAIKVQKTRNCLNTEMKSYIFSNYEPENFLKSRIPDANIFYELGDINHEHVNLYVRVLVKDENAGLLQLYLENYSYLRVSDILAIAMEENSSQIRMILSNNRLFQFDRYFLAEVRRKAVAKIAEQSVALLDQVMCESLPDFFARGTEKFHHYQWYCSQAENSQLFTRQFLFYAIAIQDSSAVNSYGRHHHIDIFSLDDQRRPIGELLLRWNLRNLELIKETLCKELDHVLFMENDFEAARNILNLFAQLNLLQESVEYRHGRTSFINKAMRGFSDAHIMFLLTRPELDPSQPDCYGYKAQHYALSSYRYDILFAILLRVDGHLSINNRMLGCSMQGNVEGVRRCLEAGAELNYAYEETRDTALHIACRQGHVELVTYLLNQRIVITRNRSFPQKYPVETRYPYELVNPDANYANAIKDAFAENFNLMPIDTVDDVKNYLIGIDRALSYPDHLWKLSLENILKLEKNLETAALESLSPFFGKVSFDQYSLRRHTGFSLPIEGNLLNPAAVTFYAGSPYLLPLLMTIYFNSKVVSQRNEYLNDAVKRNDSFHSVERIEFVQAEGRSALVTDFKMGIPYFLLSLCVGFSLPRFIAQIVSYSVRYQCVQKQLTSNYSAVWYAGFAAAIMLYCLGESDANTMAPLILLAIAELAAKIQTERIRWNCNEGVNRRVTQLRNANVLFLNKAKSMEEKWQDAPPPELIERQMLIKNAMNCFIERASVHPVAEDCIKAEFWCDNIGRGSGMECGFFRHYQLPVDPNAIQNRPAVSGGCSIM